MQTSQHQTQVDNSPGWLTLWTGQSPGWQYFMLSVSDNPGKCPDFHEIQRDDGTVVP